MEEQEAPLPEPLHEALDDLMDEATAGFWPGVEALCAQHPVWAPQLRAAARVREDIKAGVRPTLPAPPPPADPAAPPKQIGPYRIVEAIGAGGMGEVYKAEQRTPSRRYVAIKVIQQGMATKEVLARFRLEQKALASMSHNAIAKVFDAGATEKGEPYFVMEFIEGIQLDTYCDDHKLSLPERIAVFQEICAGVQHAHHKGFVHRDLKPGNVLVVREGNKAVPKILDFGLAKAMNRDVIDVTCVTETGRVFGTYEYMAPEQAAGKGEAIDARTDIYALGVMLYELLSGALPFPGLRQGGQHARLKRIQEEEPGRPSTRLSGNAKTTSEVAARRRTSLSSLRNALRGDLDWVVLKAMAKEPERRYDSAAALAADVGRYLAHEPVLAGPPGVGYRLRKFARRYRVQLAAASVVLLAVLAALIATTTFWFEARAQAEEADRQKGIAQEQTRVAETARAGEATKARDLAAKVAEFEQLAGVARLQRLQEGLDGLAVPWRDPTSAQRWLTEADRVLALRPALERTVADLRERALPATPEELARDRAAHPRLAEYDALRARLVEAERAAAMQRGEVLALPSLTPEEEALLPDELNSRATTIVDPKNYDADNQVAMPHALALAKHGWAKSEATGTKDASLADTLAWAWFWNGRDTEALRQSEAALALAPETHRAKFETNLADLRRRVAAGEGKAAVRRLMDTVAHLRAEAGSLERALGERRTYRFEAEAQGFLHDTLTGLLAKLATFKKAERTDVATRLRCAELTASHPKARATWQQAREAIEKADGLVANTLYREHPIKLPPQVGLVPIGMNPVTMLWEFYELRSAWDPATVHDPSALDVPRHDADGKIAVGADTGIVFVLLPGGTFTMGTQKESKDKPNYDPDENNPDWDHPETLAPFFLARHELTQGQWRRLGGKRGEDPIFSGDTYPIAAVDWFTSDALLRARGLTLPTEAQWEYGCRATTTTPWWTGADVASLGDELKDIRPVGTGRSNAFGLFEVHGNLHEWCADLYGSSVYRVSRGGYFGALPRFTKSAVRGGNAPTNRVIILGVRPARALRLDD